VDSDHFGMLTTLIHQALFLGVLLSGFLPWLASLIHWWEYGPIINGFIFFAFLSILANLLRIPFHLYETFVIENRYGFNTMTFKMWMIDFLKNLAIFAILGGVGPLAPLNPGHSWRNSLVVLGMDAGGRI